MLCLCISTANTCCFSAYMNLLRKRRYKTFHSWLQLSVLKVKFCRLVYFICIGVSVTTSVVCLTAKIFTGIGHKQKNLICSDCVFCYADLAYIIHFCHSVRIEIARKIIFIQYLNQQIISLKCFVAKFIVLP